MTCKKLFHCFSRHKENHVNLIRHRCWKNTRQCLLDRILFFAESMKWLCSVDLLDLGLPRFQLILLIASLYRSNISHRHFRFKSETGEFSLFSVISSTSYFFLKNHYQLCFLDRSRYILECFYHNMKNQFSRSLSLKKKLQPRKR